MSSARYAYDYDDSWIYEDDNYEESPLYPDGWLESRTIDQLEAESSRQGGIQGALGDAEYIDDAAVCRAEARCRMVENEISNRSGGQA